MKCWRDKLPNGQPVRCGNFNTWEEFVKWDGEKFCDRLCPIGYRGRQSDSAKYIHSNKAWMRQLSLGRDINGRFEDPLPIRRPYQRRVRGRRVA